MKSINESKSYVYKSVLIASFLLLLILSIGLFLYLRFAIQPNSTVETPSQKTPVKVHSDKSYPKKSIHTDSKISDEFYKQIIDNNIFRPLGWKPPKKPEQYILIGTASAQDESNSKAIIFETKSKQLHTVKVGETLGNAIVKEIQQKQVTIEKDGKEIVLKGGALQFLR